MADPAGTAAHAATTALKEAFESVGKYVIPIIGFVVGLAVANTIGGAGLIYDAITGAAPNFSTGQAAVIAKVGIGLVYGGLALVFYRMCSSSLVGYFFSFLTGLFAGVSVKFIYAGVTNTSIPNGWLDQLGSDVQQLVTE
jgi:hypothetical protein